MDIMTRQEIDREESRDIVLGGKLIRPRDAATLILLDRRGDELLVLMGRRSARHAFMPGRYVFPGGRTDPADSRVAVAQGLHPDEEIKLVGTGSRASATRARAIALSAIRETYEEAGMLIGQKGEFRTAKSGWQGFADHDVQPSLEKLRFVARAITPPKRVRRFDTRFLAAWKSDVAVTLAEGGPTDELEELVWLPIADARKVDIPWITGRVLGDLETRLADDPLLRAGGPVPFYRTIGNRYFRELI